MKHRSEKSIALYRLMIKKGFPQQFSDEVCDLLNTDWTAQRMTSYLYHCRNISLEDAADEVLAILSDRSRIMEKKMAENANASINMMMLKGLSDEE